MDYPVFEARVLELLYKTDVRLTPQAAAYRIGCGVELARGYLESMTTTGVLEMDVDGDGVITFEVPGRPAPSGEPLSWLSPAQVPPPQLMPMMLMPPPMYPPYPMVYARPLPPEKSVLGAIMLAFFFGPLGMLYSTVTGGLVMLVLTLLLVPATFGLALLVLFPAWMLWAGLAAAEHNNKVRAQLAPPRALLLR